jgi:hypothetical protein
VIAKLADVKKLIVATTEGGAITGELRIREHLDDLYRFDPVPPGVYVVSAYYSVGNRGQIEVRRSDIEVDAAQGVRVPLWVETEQ